MRTIKLYGALGRKFGKVHSFDVQSVGEALAALKANFRGFEQHLLRHSAPGYRIWVGDVGVGKDDLMLCSEGEIRIAPVVRGAGGRGLMQVILGVTLIAASFMTGGITIGAFGISQGFMFSLGASLLLGGIAQMLTKQPGQTKTSYNFNGPTNTTDQTSPVSVVYGQMMVGSQVISASITTADVSMDYTPSTPILVS